MERLPDFLIVGAMKSGTTTLYKDMSLSPDIYFPMDKEPNCLSFDDVLSDVGRSLYARNFRNAGVGAICGEASTMYTMDPLFCGAAARAKVLFRNRGLKIIYIVRDPIARIVSHFRHWYQSGRVGPDLNKEILECSHFIDFSRYAFQIQKWIEKFGEGAVRIVSLDEYSCGRQQACDGLLDFVGAARVSTSLTRVHNGGEDLGYLSDVGQSLSTSLIYRRWIRRLVPSDIRRRIAKSMGRQREVVSTTLSTDVVKRLYEALYNDSRELTAISRVEIMRYTLTEAIERFGIAS